jgi:hypothetical protein
VRSGSNTEQKRWWWNYVSRSLFWWVMTEVLPRSRPLHGKTGNIVPDQPEC